MHMDKNFFDWSIKHGIPTVRTTKYVDGVASVQYSKPDFTVSRSSRNALMFHTKTSKGVRQLRNKQAKAAVALGLATVTVLNRH